MHLSPLIPPPHSRLLLRDSSGINDIQGVNACITAYNSTWFLSVVDRTLSCQFVLLGYPPMVKWIERILAPRIYRLILAFCFMGVSCALSHELSATLHTPMPLTPRSWKLLRNRVHHTMILPTREKHLPGVLVSSTSTLAGCLSPGSTRAFYNINAYAIRLVCCERSQSRVRVSRGLSSLPHDYRDVVSQALLDVRRHVLH